VVGFRVFGDYRERLAVRRPDEILHRARKTGDAPRLTAIGSHQPDLHVAKLVITSRAITQKGQPATIR
jgi:hypothetical protein